MSTFAQTVRPTDFSFFDSDTQFQLEADAMVTFVKRSLGDDILSVELTKRMIWSKFEQATLMYGSVINEYQLKSELANMLGMTNVFSGTIVSGVLSSSVSVTSTYPRRTFEFLMRQAEPYSSYAGIGGSYDTMLGYIEMVAGRQDYNIYTEMFRGDGNQSGSLFFSTVPSSSLTKLRVFEIFHFEPFAAQHMLLNASNITNFLATQFNYESYTNSSVFYVLPVFEDVLRRGMLDMAHRVRRSHYSYQLRGRTLRIFPIPTFDLQGQTRIWLRVQTPQDPTNPSFSDSTLAGISNPSQIPFTNITYSSINQMGRNWIRQYTMALCTELLGRVRRKIKKIPIPGADLELDGSDLVNEGKEERIKLLDNLREFLQSLTYDKLIELEAQKAENLNKQLRFIPMMKPIFIG